MIKTRIRVMFVIKSDNLKIYYLRRFPQLFLGYRSNNSEVFDLGISSALCPVFLGKAPDQLSP